MKVDIGIPHALWDSSPVEVTHLQRECARLLNEEEELIERWFFHVLPKRSTRPPAGAQSDASVSSPSNDITEFMCRQNVLRNRYSSMPQLSYYMLLPRLFCLLATNLALQAIF